MLLGAVLAFPFVFPVLMASRKRRKTVRQRLGMAALPDEVQRAIA